MRDLNQITIERDISETSLETSQKRWLFCDVFKTSQIHLRKDVFFVTSLRRLKNISKKTSFLWHLWGVSKNLSQVFAVFQKYPTKMISCDFHRVITVSGKIDLGLLETLKKWNVFRAYISIKSVMSISGLLSAREFWQVTDCQSPILGVLFTTFSDFFRLMKLYITCCHYEMCWNTDILVKFDKKCVIRFAIDIWSTFLMTMLFFL